MTTKTKTKRTKNESTYRNWTIFRLRGVKSFMKELNLEYFDLLRHRALATDLLVDEMIKSLKKGGK